MKNILRTLLPLLFTACLATAAAAAESEARQALEQKVGNVLHILDTADLTSPEARLAALEGRLGWTARGGDAGTVP